MQMYFVSYRMLCDLIHVRSNIQFYFNIRYIRNLYFRIRILIGHMSISAQIPRSGTCNTLFPVRRTVNKIKAIVQLSCLPSHRRHRPQRTRAGDLSELQLSRTWPLSCHD